jgi:hypothetical protein
MRISMSYSSQRPHDLVKPENGLKRKNRDE